MTEPTNRRIVLAARPEGEPTPDHFRRESAPLPEPGPGQILIQIHWLSLDPYMRGRMSAAKSYAKPVGIGEVMEGGTVGEVVVSNHPVYASGDFVLSHSGWQEYAVADGDSVRKLDPNFAPVSTALGVLGMPGMTAYTGLLNIGQPKSGETVVVAAAAGPVGSLVGQIAKIKGCHVVGLAGGLEKCAYLLNELGFDAAIDHRASDMPERLAEACPRGVDVYFENVGGAVWNAVFPLLNDFARVPVCGLVAHYNDTTLPPGPDRTPLLMRAVLSKRLTLRGFIVRDFASQADEFRREVGTWLESGQIKYREDVVEGLEHAPEAFIGMLKGRNLGKTLVRIGQN
ncbi:NADP-dependent oxidoreductase [Microvirga zambiensis]|uniref:NADP-dependent oxidoreductase n=1 Tax=Microvirga zambiensis TaxID=1402137 RepID=UPI00191D3A64|nr:NADP-dependent oxidoreductase [Microvirga zambiensis]